MSSASAEKFQPSWIRSAFHGNGGSIPSSPRASINDDDANIEPCQPVLSKNRYGREEVLMLQPKPSRPPRGLEQCAIFSRDARDPTVMTPVTELEQRLQMNINSSKAMSSLSQSDRMAVATGGTPNGPNSPQVKGRTEWTPVKGNASWGRGASQYGGPGAINGRGSFNRLGRTSTDEQPTYGQKYVPRGRGGAGSGRGASTTAGAAQINSRAQALYDAQNPKDRPRNRLRSQSDDTEPTEGDNGGWSQPVSRFGRQNSAAWNKEDNSWTQSAERENSYNHKQDNGGEMPEWFDDADEVEKAERPGGSFDDDGRYRQPKENSSLRWRPTQGDADRDPRSYPTASYQTPKAPSPAAPPVEPPVPTPPPSNKFYYLDPTDVERGPFTKDQMYAWYNMQYFTDQLKVRRAEDKQYRTLGELKIQNGVTTVFDYKIQPPQQVPPTFGMSNASFGQNLFPAPTVWNEMFQPQLFNPNVAAAFDDKNMMMEKQRFEMQQQIEMEKIRMVAQKQAEAQKRAIETKEQEYMRQQEEMRKKYEEEMLRQKMEHMELQKKLEALEADKKQKLEEERRRHEEELRRVAGENARKAAELKKIEEEQRKLEEEKRRKEAEVRRKQEEEDRKKKAEDAAEQHRKELQKKAEEDAARIKAQEAARKEEEERKKAAKDAERMFNSELSWESSKPTTPAIESDSPWQAATTKKSASQKPKVAPWSNLPTQTLTREKSLREIQEEEERQQAAEAKETAKRKEQENQSSSAQISAGIWSNSNRISWTGTTTAAKVPTKPAWGGVGVEQKPAASINWDGPTLQAANKPSAPAKKNTSPPPAPMKIVPAKPKQENIFNQWVIKRMKEINGSVDAEILCGFLEGVENPNEVEDFIEGSLGLSKAAKEFVKEYLQKRSESRKRKDTEKDDLSSASQAGSGTGSAQGKKKKGKNTRLVVDGSCLGFRATSDPNRVNQGEIETVPLTAGQKR